MNRLKSWLKAIALTWLLLLSLVAHAADVPMLKRHITDQTNTLTSEQIEQLDKKLLALEQNKGAQLVVLMVPTTTPQDIESYALAVFEANEIGRKDTDDGILLLIAKDDRRNRIEVGYGLEGAVPDAIAAQILRESLAPYFKQGDFFSGIDVGVDQLIKLINGETLPPPTQTTNNSNDLLGILLLILFSLFPMFIARIIVFAILSKEKAKNLKIRILWGAGVVSVLSFIFTLPIMNHFFIESLFTILIGAIIGALVFAIPPSITNRFTISVGSSSGGGLSSGGGFRSGGGGFSGGGGRSGGGGASGSW